MKKYCLPATLWFLVYISRAIVAYQIFVMKKIVIIIIILIKDLAQIVF